MRHTQFTELQAHLACASSTLQFFFFFFKAEQYYAMQICSCTTQTVKYANLHQYSLLELEHTLRHWWIKSENDAFKFFNSQAVCQ